MEDSKKTKKQLIAELRKLRKKIAKLEESQSKSKVIEKELMRDRALFQSFMDNIPISVYFKDKEGRLLRVSRYYLKQEGAPDVDSVEKTIGKTDFDLFSEELAKEAREDELRIMETGKPIIDREEISKTADGKTVYLLANKAPFTDDQGNIVGILGVTRDISKRKELEKELKYQRLLLKDLLDNVPDHIYFKDKESRFIHASKSVAEQFGVESVDKLIGKTDFDYFTKEHAEAAYRDEQEIIKTGKLILNKIEKETHPDGKTTWVLTTKIPRYDEKGNIVGILGISRDVTERKKLEEKLEKRVEELGVEIVFKSLLLTSLLDNIPDHIYFKDKKSRFVVVSKALADWLGAASSDDMIGKTDFDYFTVEHARPAYEDEQEVIGSGKPIEGKFEKETYPDGRITWVSTTKIPWYDEDGNIIGTLGISRDVTELKNKEVELIEARKIAQKASSAKTTFLAIVSHEIRTPLNAIIGMCEILEETVLSKEQHDYLKVLREAGESLLAIINDVLDISKIESGDVQIEKSEFYLDGLVEKVCDILAIRAHKKGVELVGHISPNVPIGLVGDSYRLRQILVNLIGNSIKFTDEGEIVLSIKLAEEEGIQCKTKEKKGVCLLFSVKDTGVGIPKEKQKAIFESFKQADSSTTRKFGGTGLGLSISKRLIELMGGEMWVESEEGKGSEFFFTVQFEIQKAKKTHTFIEPEEVDIKGITALIVDDNTTNRLILKEILTAWDADVTEASGGEEAISIINSARKKGKNFRLVLLDRRMPSVDGFKVAEVIREDERSEETTTIMMLTSDHRISDLARIDKLGIGCYLVKPIKRDELKNAILTTLGLWKAKKKEKEIEKVKVSDLPPMKILLVEDTEDNRLLIRAFLQKSSVEIEEAENGKIAFEKFKKNVYDLVLMDMQMPVMDGYTATRKIRAWEKRINAEETPVIALTAYALKGDAEKSLDAGCNTHVAKPVKMETLVKVLKEFADKLGL
jgi:two-component system sensor histidine kinase/response regulator